MKKLKLNRLYIIEWVDHATFSDNIWRSREELGTLKPVPICSVGFIMHDREDHLVLCSTYSSDKTMCNEFCIIKSCIVKVKPLDAFIEVK
jgi:hypothetical protein